MVILHHFAGSVKGYLEVVQVQSCAFPLPDHCPHPDCQAAGSLIRWGTYQRWACSTEEDHLIPIQRVRCKVCGRTHSLLPDFLHPHRHYVVRLLQRVVELVLLLGLSWKQVMDRLSGSGPARSTIREWVGSFAYGAGHLLLGFLLRQLLALDPTVELPDQPPEHLQRVPDAAKRRRLERAHAFWLLGERLYAEVKARLPRLHFSARQLLPFLLHWLQSHALPPRLFWSPALPTTPTAPF